MADFGRAIELDPGYAPALTNRGLANRQIGEEQRALADFNNALAADENYVPALIARANLLRVQGQSERALRGSRQGPSISIPNRRRRCTRAASCISA